MKLAAFAAALLVLPAVPPAAGAEGDAPLSDSKKELQRLQSERGTQGAPGAKDGLKSNVPTMQLPATTDAVYQRPTHKQRERDQQTQKSAGKNWLIEGMARLEGGARTGALLPGDDVADPAGEGDDAVIDASDPAYLLKLYDRQRKAEDARSAEAKTPKGPRADAFAPFLQDWMAASPIKDQLLGDLGRPGGDGFGPAGSPVPGATAGGRGTMGPLVSSREAAPAAAPNPYLSEAGTAALNPAGGFSLASSVPASAPARVPDAPVITLSPGPAVQPAVPAAQADRKAPPPPLADDKKYFPQLNKF